MPKFSDNQQRAKKEIERITEHFGKDRWFIQKEVIGAGYKTLMALVNKRYLITQCFGDVEYYQLKTSDDDAQNHPQPGVSCSPKSHETPE